MRHWRTSVAFLGLFATHAAAASASASDQPRCTELVFSVSLGDDLPGPYRLAGRLCRPHREAGRVLQVLIHGASYNRGYWDFADPSRRYSYVWHSNRAGFATLALDRLGAGASDHPPPEVLTVHAQAFTLHQVVSALRSGSVVGADGRHAGFDRIVLVGHSFGSNISWTEAGIYGDVDGLVLTAISHDLNPPGAALIPLYTYPAALDPLFSELDLPLGYLTTLPGTVGELFYYLPGADPEVIAKDEATKDVVPVGLFFDQFTTYELTQNIHVPVLNVVGDFDTLSCQLPSCTESGSIANESSYYAPDACYTQLIVPRAGHAINLHKTAPVWYRKALSWVARQVGDDDRGSSRHRHR